MKRPLFGSNLAPGGSREGKFDVVHLCTGGRISYSWRFEDALDITKGENELQGVPDLAYCSQQDDCLGFAVFHHNPLAPQDTGV